MKTSSNDATLVPLVFDAIQTYDPLASTGTLNQFKVLLPLTPEAVLILILGLESSTSVPLRIHVIFGGGAPTKLHRRVNTLFKRTILIFGPSICMSGTTNIISIMIQFLYRAS